MKRLTTEAPAGNFETMLNFVFSKDGWAYIRHDGEGKSVPLTQWAKAQCILHGCGEFSAETPQEIDEAICDCMMDFPDCPIALAYCFASQATHLRSRLKMYEDILFAEDGSELLTQDDLQKAVKSNDLPAQEKTEPMTKDQVKGMVGNWVWVVVQYEHCQCEGWGFIPTPAYVAYLDQTLPTDSYGKKFVAYRYRPEEAAS